MEWKKGFILGVLSGVLWGWLALGWRLLAGDAPLENSLPHNLAAFSTGGALFGVVIGGFMVALRDRICQNPYLKAALLSLGLWGLLRIGGEVLSAMNPERYCSTMDETSLGFVLALAMGLILGMMWNAQNRVASNE